MSQARPDNRPDINSAQRSTFWRFTLLLGMTLIVCWFALLSGNIEMTHSQLWQCLVDECSDPMQQTILHDIRAPRVLLALFAGAGLALCGALLQTITRNPLADPYLFGLMAGAALGATITTLLLPKTTDWFWSLPFGAFVGAIVAVTMVVLLSVRFGLARIESLLLSGLAVSFMCSAISTFLLYLADPFAANRVMFWLMGSLSRADYSAVWMIAPLLLLCCLLCVVFRRPLAALTLGDDTARSLGIRLQPLRVIILLMTAALTAVIVAYCGGIAFVGLMIPHLVRLWLGIQPMTLLLGSVFAGGLFLLLVDTLGRTLFTHQEIPLGVITSAIGSLFFMMLMFGYYRQR